MKKILVLIVTFGIFSSFSVKAETTNSWYNKFYVGAGVGFFPGEFETKYNNNPSNRGFHKFIYNNNINLFIGYNVLPFLSLEIGYRHFLKEKKYQSVDSTDPFMERLDYMGEDLYLNSILKYNIKRHTPFLIFGISKIQLNVKYIYTPIDQQLLLFENEGISYILGLGYEYALTTHNHIGFKYNYTIAPKLDHKMTDYDYPNGNLDIKNLRTLKYSNISLYYKFSL